MVICLWWFYIRNLLLIAFIVLWRLVIFIGLRCMRSLFVSYFAWPANFLDQLRWLDLVSLMLQIHLHMHLLILFFLNHFLLRPRHRNILFMLVHSIIIVSFLIPLMLNKFWATFDGFNKWGMQLQWFLLSIIFLALSLGVVVVMPNFVKLFSLRFISLMVLMREIVKDLLLLCGHLGPDHTHLLHDQCRVPVRMQLLEFLSFLLAKENVGWQRFLGGTGFRTHSWRMFLCLFWIFHRLNSGLI